MKPKSEDMRALALNSMVNAGVLLKPATRTLVTEIPQNVSRGLVFTGLYLSTRPNVDQVCCFC